MSEHEEDFATLFEASVKARRFEQGQTIEGTIVAIGAEVAFVSVGAKSDLERQVEGREKTGVYIGAHALNPATGERIPVFIADYVLMGYGTGAIMAVPGEDQRDWDFATAYGLPIVRTVAPPDGWEGEAYTGDGPAINSEWLNGLDKEHAVKAAIEWIEAQGIGRRTVNYRLRDWLVSRQRFWGCPIPVVYCPDQLGPSVSRLVPGGLSQFTFPQMAAPQIVDWRDYRARISAADPDAFARSLLARVPPGHQQRA